MSHDLFDERWSRATGADSLVLLVRDATCMVVFWEILPARRALVERHLHATWNRLDWVLRLHDVTDLLFNGRNAHYTRQVQVDAQADHYYFPDVEAGRHYVADFGLPIGTGEFFALLRSQMAPTPRLTCPPEQAQSGTGAVRDTGRDAALATGTAAANAAWASSIDQTSPPVTSGSRQRAVPVTQPGLWPHADQFDGYGSSRPIDRDDARSGR